MTATSEVHFRKRALEIGLSEAQFTTLVNADIKTAKKLAFSCGYQCTGDETPFVDMVKTLYGAEVTLGTIAAMRE
eukprot:6467767-Amphidinium_carterae.1